MAYSQAQARLGKAKCKGNIHGSAKRCLQPGNGKKANETIPKYAEAADNEDFWEFLSKSELKSYINRI